MAKRPIAGISRAAIMTAVLIVASGSTGAQAKTCWPFGTIIATAGVAVKQDTAKKFARINWRVNVRTTATTGTAYTNWDLANNRQYHCVKSSARGGVAPRRRHAAPDTAMYGWPSRVMPCGTNERRRAFPD